MKEKLAIKGHATRGNEVIEILKMLGGENTAYYGLDINVIYTIDDKGLIRSLFFNDSVLMKMEYDIFTLEEFLEKYPFKVGDFVRIPEYESEVRILKMKWCPVSKHIEYLVCPNDEDEWFTADELLEDNDNPNETTDCKKCGLHFGSVKCFDKDCPKSVDEEAIFKIGPVMVPDMVDDKLEYDIIDGYEFDRVENGKIILKPIKTEYPKTYKECCDVLLIPPYYNLRYHTYEPNYDEYATSKTLLSLEDKLNTLGKLFICRNAYWKMAGEKMGLGKPWEPDWDNLSTNHEFIKIDKGCFTYSSRVLVFPTEEMRDAFCENFDELIESCKELL